MPSMAALENVVSKAEAMMRNEMLVMKVCGVRVCMVVLFFWCVVLIISRSSPIDRKVPSMFGWSSEPYARSQRSPEIVSITDVPRIVGLCVASPSHLFWKDDWVKNW